MAFDASKATMASSQAKSHDLQEFQYGLKEKDTAFQAQYNAKMDSLQTAAKNMAKYYETKQQQDDLSLKNINFRGP